VGFAQKLKDGADRAPLRESGRTETQRHRGTKKGRKKKY
jgi:hypothetical protein